MHKTSFIFFYLNVDALIFDDFLQSVTYVVHKRKYIHPTPTHLRK